MRTINDPRDDCHQTMDADDQFAEPLANDLRQLQQLEKCLIKIEFRNIISHYQLQTLQKYTINEIPLTPLHSVSPSSPTSPIYEEINASQPSAVPEYKNLDTSNNFNLGSSYFFLGNFENNFARNENKTYESLNLLIFLFI